MSRDGFSGFRLKESYRKQRDFCYDSFECYQSDLSEDDLYIVAQAYRNELNGVLWFLARLGVLSPDEHKEEVERLKQLFPTYAVHRHKA